MVKMHGQAIHPGCFQESRRIWRLTFLFLLREKKKREQQICQRFAHVNFSHLVHSLHPTPPERFLTFYGWFVGSLFAETNSTFESRVVQQFK